MPEVTRKSLAAGPRGMWRYASLLPVPAGSEPVSLGEGDTPLIRSRRIGPSLGLSNLFFKLESANPTGSYKDRIASVALTLAVSAGKTAVIATSSGNSGAAAAAYCSQAALPCHLFVLDHTAEAKVMQAEMYGARIIAIKDFSIDPRVSQSVFDLIRETSGRQGWELMVTAVTFNPDAMQGARTIAFEICQQLDWQAPDRIFVPVGGGGLLASCWQGFAEFRDRGLVEAAPRVWSAQPEGCDHVARAFAAGLRHAEPVTNTSRISGLQVPSPVDGAPALAALYASGGGAATVSDDEIFAAQRRLAAEEGIFAEPAGAAATAALIKIATTGQVDPAERVVALVTGTGFKDLDSIRAGTADYRLPTLSLAELEVHLAQLT